MKGFLWFSLIILVLLLCSGLLLTYWFPANMVRQELEIRLSDLLQGTVRIHSLSFNLLTGLQISQMEFIKPNQPPLTLDYLTLDYSLLHLLKGTFTINEISIHQANVSLNLPDLIKDAPEPTPPPPSEPTAFPTLPVSIDLEIFKIIESNIHVVVSPEFAVNFTRLNLQSSGGISSDKAHLRGTLQVEQLALAFQDKHFQLPLVVKFDADTNFPAQHLDLKQLTIESEPAFRLTLLGTISEFFAQKAVHLSLADSHFDLEMIVGLARDFVPPELATATMGGTLSPSLTLIGALPDSGFQGTIRTEITGKNIQIHLPDQALRIGPTDLALSANDVQIKENLPLKGKIAATLSMQDLAYQTYGLRNFNFMLDSDYQAPGPFSGNLKISGTTPLPGELLGTSFNLPFAIVLETSGNHQTHQVQVKKLNVDLNPYGTMQMKAALNPYSSPKQGMKASFEARLSPNIKALLARLPKDRLQGLVLQKGSDPDTLVLQATAALHPDFRPEWGKATVAINLSSLRARWDSMAIEGTLQKLTLLFASGYQERNGAFQGTVGVSSRLSNLHGHEGLTIGTGNVVLKSSFQGQLSPTYQPTSLRSQDQFQLTIGNAMYRHPSLTATLPLLKLSSKTKEDVFNNIYLLESLRLTSDQILEVDMKGRFMQPTQQFDVDMQIPLLHVGNLLPHLSGPLMEGVGKTDPKGWVSLIVRAAGKVPQAADLKKLHLPLGMQGRLTLRDLNGAVAGYQIKGGNGTMAIGYSPRATPQAQFISDVKLDHIHLPDTLPIRQVADTSLRVSMLSSDLNEIQINPVHVAAKGMDFSLKGAVVGLRELLISTSTPGTNLAKLFAQLQARLGLDVETFQKALQPFGVQGTGKAVIDLSMLKKEQGNLDASVQIGTETLALTGHDLELHDMNGGIQLRKSLAFKPDSLLSPLKKTFHPSEHIAQLKAWTRKGETLTIDRLRFRTFEIRNLSTNLAFEQQALKIQNLAMNTLGGGIGGNITIAAEHPLRVSAELEVANLDANQLIETQSKISGDSQIAATLGLTTILQEATGAVDLSRLECTLHITHIGKEALDRLLVFLDPEGSNPTISNARAQLHLANPSRVTVEVARGQLNLTIHFQGSFLPIFKLNRIPIAKMKNLEKLTAAIPNWKDLTQVLEWMGAETYSFTPEGEVVVQ